MEASCRAGHHVEEHGADQGHRFDVLHKMQGRHRRARSIKRFKIPGLNQNKYVELFTAYLTY